MLYIRMRNDLPIGVYQSYEAAINGCGDNFPVTAQSRWDWKSKEEVDRLAMFLTAMTGKSYIGTDAGDSVFPQFDIVEIPSVGDKVSYAFNGDCYPDGEIVSINKKNLKITTSSGQVYKRRKNTGSWTQGQGGWYLVNGHHYEQNPHF